MLHAFQSYITKYKLSSPKMTLIGVSGGRDSVVLCELYFQAKLPFAIAHCNFNLRGSESDEDEAFVVGLAKKYQVKLHKKSCNTKLYAKENGISIQMAARELRFDWFRKLVKGKDYAYYATAHHEDDAIETYLINQIRGTGIAGLHGILPKINQLIHPLLFATRKDIDSYIERYSIPYREDSSNSSTKYLRNKIRHDLIPLLVEINPQIKKVFIDNMQRISSAEKLLQLKIDECKKELCSFNDNIIQIKINNFKNHEFAPTLLFELIKGYGFNYSQATQAIQANNKTLSGALYHSSSHKMLRDREQILIERNKHSMEGIYYIEENTSSIDFPIQLKLSKSKKSTILQDPNIAQLDFNKLLFPLKIRKWNKGDFFYPLGMKGKKKLLSDYFIDQKLSLFEKENVWLLCSGKDIVWIISYRMDDRYKISEITQEIYKISIIAR